MTWIVIKAGALMGQIPKAAGNPKGRKEGRREIKKTFFVQVHIIGVLKSGLKWFQGSTSKAYISLSNGNTFYHVSRVLMNIMNIRLTGSHSRPWKPPTHVSFLFRFPSVRGGFST